MVKRLFDVDPLTGTRQYFHMDDADDHFMIETVQPTDDIVEANKAAFNEFNRSDDTFGDLIGQRTRVASIPMHIYMDLLKRGILRDQAALKRWLNDPDNAAFRTRPGVV